jgi:hypothetical protein
MRVSGSAFSANFISEKTEINQVEEKQAEINDYKLRWRQTVLTRYLNLWLLSVTEVRENEDHNIQR